MTARPTRTRSRLKAQRPNSAHDLLCNQLTLCGIQGHTREYLAIPGRKYRIDVAFVAQKIAVEVMGGVFSNGRHTRGEGYESDCEKASLLAGLGWLYVPVTSDQVRSGKALAWIESALRARKGYAA